MASFLWLLYEAGLGLVLLLAGPFLLARRGKHYLPTLSGRLGGSAEPAPKGRPLWIHAVSVGEVGVAATLARALPGSLPLVVTTITPTGQALARRLFAGRGQVAYLPFDLRFAIGRFWRRFAPAALILVEGDYWPLLLREAGRRGLPVAVVNGRVGDRGFGRLQRLRRLRPLTRLLFGRVGRFGMQAREDRDRLEQLGVPPERLAVTGNLKFDTAEPAASPQVQELLAACERLAGGRPLLIAGSTMAGEDEQVVAAFQGMGGGRRALLVLAPRHPERWDEVDRLLRQSGLSTLRRTSLSSQATSAGGGAPPEAAADSAIATVNSAAAAATAGAATAAGADPGDKGIDVLLLDTVGELAALYRIGAAAFIGGTLVATGGHNPLEAARFGLPIAVGPSMHNFRDVAARFDAAGAWRRVAGPQELAAAWAEWLDNPAAGRDQGARAAALLAANRGALARTLDLLAPLLADLAPAGGGRAGAGEGPAIEAGAGAPAGAGPQAGASRGV